MLQLLRVFLDIVRLRQGPQALPASTLLLGMVLGLHFSLGVVLLSYTLAFGEALLGALIGTALVVALVHLALTLRGVPGRLLQTATALAGAEFLLALATLPFTVWYYAGGSIGVASVVSLLMVGWSLVVAAHIFRHALALRPWTGFALALVYMVISYAVAGLFTGPGA